MSSVPTLHEAQRLHLEGLLSEAEAAYEALVREAAPAPEVLYLYGTLKLQQDEWADATRLLTLAVEQRPEWVAAHANLATAYFRQQRLPEARAAYQEALRHDPQQPQVHASLAATYVNQNTPHLALTHARAALALDAECAPAHWNAALAHLELGEWEPGWREYEWGFVTGERTRRNYHADRETPGWNGAPGRTVVLHGEQGLGDEILFASCVADAQRLSKNTILECHPRLASLFARSFPGVLVKGTRKDEYVAWPEDVERDAPIDAKLALGSLPRLFRRTDANFPRHGGYLRADPERVAFYRCSLGPSPRIGIAWTGGTAPTYRDLRSIPLAAWAPLLAAGRTSSVPAQFVSLQYTQGADSEAARYGLTHLQTAIDDLDEHAALIASCDLVISVCQTAVHLAGALGVETWCLTPAAPAWRYRVESAPMPSMMPWYPAVTLLRQRTSGDWGPVMDEAARKLEAWFLVHSASRGTGGRSPL